MKRWNDPTATHRLANYTPRVTMCGRKLGSGVVIAPSIQLADCEICLRTERRQAADARVLVPVVRWIQ